MNTFHRLSRANALVFIAAGALLAGCGSPAAAHRNWADAPHWMAAADHADASAAGAALLARGGNAVDAAVATSLALAVVRPESCGLGGGGFMVIHRPGAAPIALDFRETCPARAELANYRDAAGAPIPGRTRRGAWAVAVPAQVRGLMFALDRYGSGRVSRAEVVAPALSLARRPLIVDRHLHQSIDAWADDFGTHAADPEFAPLAAWIRPGGRTPEIGECVSCTDIAATLQSIADRGAAGFYEGPPGEAMLAAIHRFGGPLTREDFGRYEVRVLTPLAAQLGPYQFITMPPPSSGGAVILEILQAMAESPGEMPRWNPAAADDLHRLAETMKHAFADRARTLGDRSDVVLADVERMISPQRASEIRAAIDPRRARPVSPAPEPPQDRGTSHYCVVDAAGMAVAGTDTINDFFGSGMLVPGTGVILNNQMDDFAVDTETPNLYGLRQSERNLIAPGRRPLSSMSPTIILRGGQVEMLAGGSDGPRIISATLLTILNHLGGGMPIDAAVAAPRLHHQWLPDRLYLQKGFAPALGEELARRGHTLKTGVTTIGHVQTIARTPEGWRGVSDPDKGGAPRGG